MFFGGITCRRRSRGCGRIWRRDSVDSVLVVCIGSLEMGVCGVICGEEGGVCERS